MSILKAAYPYSTIVAANRQRKSDSLKITNIDMVVITLNIDDYMVRCGGGGNSALITFP